MNFADNVFVAGFFKIGDNNFHSVFISIFAGFSEQFCGPQAQKLIGARRDFEFYVCVMNKFVLKGGFAIIKCRRFLSPLALLSPYR